MCGESKQEVKKVVFLVKMVENLPSVSSLSFNANLSPFWKEYIPFLKGLGVQESRQDISKIVSLCIMAKNLPGLSVSSPV